MTTPITRLAEIAERKQVEKAQFDAEWEDARLDPLIADMKPLLRRLCKAVAFAAWLERAERAATQLTAAQARSREDAEIMRAAADALDEHYDDSGNCFSCHSPCIPDPENYDDLDPSDLVHTSDCLVTKLRARADELEGRT